MNRLATQPTTLEPVCPPSTDASFSLPTEKLHGFSQGLADHAVRPACRPAAFCPLHYECGYAYPLIVWLHDEGSSEQDLRRVMPRISLRNYVAVGPRGTQRICSKAGACTWSQDADGIELAVERVHESIEFVRGQLNVSKKRIFIAGRGAGGTMALRIAFLHPEWFAGAVSLDGLLPRAGQPLCRVSELRELPLLLSTRMDPSGAGEAELCRDLRLLHTAGMSVSLRHYRGDESVVPRMLGDMDRWIMRLICEPGELD